MALTVQKTDTVKASAKQRKLLAEYRRLQQMQELLTAEMAPVKAALSESFPEGVRYLLDEDGEKAATLFPTASSGSFDRKGLLAAHPRIHARFWTPGVAGAGTPRLTIY